MSITPVTPVVEMMIGGVWTDITEDVRLASADSGGGIRIKRGVPNEGTRAEPTRVDFVLNNREGKYSPKNEMSVNYGKLGQNTPVRFGLLRRSDDFSHAETDSWGRMPSWEDSEFVTQLGDKWRLTGGANRFDISGGVATINSGAGYSMATVGTYGDVEILTRVKTSVRDSEFGVVMRLEDPALDEQDWESGTKDWVPTGGSLSLNQVQVHTGTTSGLVTVSGSPASVHLRPPEGTIPVLPGRSYRARMWVRSSISTTLTGVINWRLADGVTATGSSATSAVAVTANTWTLIEVTATAPDLADFAIYGWSAISTSPPNGTLFFCDDLEFLENDNLRAYTAYITPGSPDLLRFGAIAPGTSAAIGQPQTVNINTNEYWWIKAQMSGIRRRVKYWKDGTPEPRAWTFRSSLLGVNDGRQQPGKVGMVGLFAKDGTSTVTFDSIQITVWRAHAEITELPPRWDLSREDRWVPIVAQGVLRRQGQGRKTLDSATTLYLKSYVESKMWVPLESFESSGTTVPNLIQGGITPVAKNLTSSATEETGVAALPGISGFADFAAADSYLRVAARPGAAAGTWSYLCFFRVPNAPASDILLYRVDSSGTARTWFIYLQTDQAVRVEAYAGDGTLLDSDVVTLYNGTVDLPYGSWIAANLLVKSSGGTVTWAWNYHHPGSDAFLTANGSFAGSAGVWGGTTYQSSAVHTAAGNMQIAQCFHWPGDLPFVTDAFAKAAVAYLGEASGVRWQRLADNARIANTTTGFATDTQEMGTQSPSKTLDLMDECVQVDDAIQMEARDDFSLDLRTRISLLNQVPLALDIDEGHLTAPLDPTGDDQATRNDVTVRRKNGGQARSIQESGPLNVNDPEDDPDGVGTYDEAPEMNYWSDDQLQGAADWRRSKGTIDDLRYPSMNINLNSAPYDEDPEKALAVLSLDAGDMIELTNREVSYEPTVQMVVSYEEFFDQYDYQLNFVTKPGKLYTVGIVGYSTRVQTLYQLLAADFNAGTDTQLQSEVTAPGILWVQVADSPKSFPFDIMVQGCRLRVRSTGVVLNSNPYFDAGISGYEPANSTTLYWERRIGFTRTWANPCIRATSTATGNSGIVATQATQVAVTPGETIRVSAWIKADASIPVNVRGSFYAANGTTFVSNVSGSAVTPAANTWVHVSADIVVPATAAFVRTSPHAVIGVIGQVVWFDDVRVMKPATYAASPQTLHVEQAPINGVIKVLEENSPVRVADPWRVAF